MFMMPSQVKISTCVEVSGCACIISYYVVRKTMAYQLLIKTSAHSSSESDARSACSPTLSDGDVCTALGSVPDYFRQA